MRYDELVTEIAKRSQNPKYLVKAILREFPHVLKDLLQEGDSILTPLGSMRAVRRKTRKVMPPDKSAPIEVPEKIIIKLKPGKRLRRNVS